MGDCKEYKRPSKAPHVTDENSGILWIWIDAYKLISQSTLARAGLEMGDLEYTFKFIVQNDISENIGHEWASYESIVSRLTQKGADIGKTIREIKNMVGAVSDSWMEKRLRSKKGIGDYLKNSIQNAADKSVVAYHRVDTPLVYSNSPRREYEFLVHLIDEGDPYQDIIKPVRELEKLSSPEQDTWSKINPPYVFSLKTRAGDSQEIPLIKIDFAALTSIQPIYKGPFRKGFPTLCDLTLKFIDIQPLYRSSFDIMSGSEGTLTTNPE